MFLLETERLYLRQWVPDDWIRFKPLVVDPRVIRYIQQGGPWADDRIQRRVREYIRYGDTRGWQLWPVIHRADTRLIGFCGFSDGFLPDVEIGWRLLPEYWGQGLATEIAAATLDYGFRTWHFPRVIAVAQTPNRASIRVMEKIGMVFDGTFDDQGTEVVRYVVNRPQIAAHLSVEPLRCRHATEDDLCLLAGMNRKLIEDECSRNPMSLPELEKRMAGWMDGSWQLVVIELAQRPVGYVVFQLRGDDYHPDDPTAYLRQFYIQRDQRSRGIGRRAFEGVVKTFFSHVTAIVLDVLETNPRAQHFWKQLGFEPYCTTMRRNMR